MATLTPLPLLLCFLACFASTLYASSTEKGSSSHATSPESTNSDWASNRKALADCAVGFGKDPIGDKDAATYEVTDPTDDPVDPKPDTEVTADACKYLSRLKFHMRPSSLPSAARLSHVRTLVDLTRTYTHPPKLFNHKYRTHAIIHRHTAKCKMGESIGAEKLRSEFLQVLRSRRTGEVPLSVEPAKPGVNPLCQGDTPPASDEIVGSCPKGNIDNLKEEHFYLTTEEGEQGRLPTLILSLKENNHQRRPAVVLLHGTHSNKESLCPLLQAFASRGYVAIAIDARYHGERASSKTAYMDALVSAWKTGETMPFIYDTVWDLIKLADYLTRREDIDPAMIGIAGISLGGMHSWFAGFADTRYSVVVPIIGVQGFRWAIDNDKWQARVDSIKPVFEVAREDLGKSAIDKEVVKKVWDRIAPGLASQFDSPHSIPAIATRPLLILNGAEDPRCPLGGLKVPISEAHRAYEKSHCLENFKFIAERGVGHQLTTFMVNETNDWFDRLLNP